MRWHYLSLAERQWSLCVAGRATILAKRYFYVLRPVLTLRHLRLHALRPPMAMDALIAETVLPDAERAAITALRAAKAATGEHQSIPRSAVLDALIEAEIAWAHDHSGATRPVPCELVEAAETLFALIVSRS